MTCIQFIYNLEFTNSPLKAAINDTTSIEEYFKLITYFKFYPLRALGNIHSFSYAEIANEAKQIKNLTIVNLICSLSSEQKYAGWEDWKKYAFLLHLQQNNKRDLYESLGYSLAYVTES